MAMAHQKKYGAPADYEELYQEYSEYVQRVLVKIGIDSQDAAEQASELLLRFVEKGGLGWYDPDRKFRIGYVGKPTNKITLKPGEEPPAGFVLTGERTAAFMGMFKVYVGRSALGIRDRLYSLHKREVLGAYEQDVRPGTVGSTEVPTEEEEIVLRTSIQQVKAELFRRAVARGVVGSSKDLSRLFVEIERQMETEGRLDRKALAAIFGVGVPEITRRINELRAILSEQGLSPKELVA